MSQNLFCQKMVLVLQTTFIMKRLQILTAFLLVTALSSCAQNKSKHATMRTDYIKKSNIECQFTVMNDWGNIQEIITEINKDQGFIAFMEQTKAASFISGINDIKIILKTFLIILFGEEKYLHKSKNLIKKINQNYVIKRTNGRNVRRKCLSKT